MAATLSSDMDNTDTVKIFYDDALANKLKVLGPDVNASEYRFAPVDRSTIRYGLGAVKGTGEQAVNVILKARAEGGPFKDLFDFCLRVDKRMVNRRTVNQCCCRGDNAITTGFNNAVVLSFTQAKIIRIHNQYAFHSRPQLVLFAFEFLDTPGEVWQPFFMRQNQLTRQNLGIAVRMHQRTQV